MPAYDSYLRKQLSRALVAAASSGAHPVVLTAPYYLRDRRTDGTLWPEDRPQRVDRFDAILRAVATAHDAGVIDLRRRMSGGQNHYVATQDGVRLQYDGVHIAPRGARWLAAWLYKRLQQASGS
jgi:lysophospholipase L1-like esterase